MLLKLNKDAIVYLTGVVDILKDLTSDVVIRVSSKGIQIQGMDSSHIAFIDFLMNDHITYDTEVTTDDSAESDVQHFGVHLPSMYRILKLGSGVDSCTMSDEEQDLLHFEFESSKKHLKIDLTLLDLDFENFNPQDWEYPNMFTIPSSEFSNVCKDVSSLGLDHVQIGVDAEAVVFSANSSQNVSNFEMIYIPTNKQFTEPTQGPGMYSLKHLSYFSKASGFTKDVQVSFSKDYPLRLKFDLGEKSMLCFYLASRIKD